MYYSLQSLRTNRFFKSILWNYELYFPVSIVEKYPCLRARIHTHIHMNTHTKYSRPIFYLQLSVYCIR